MLLRCPMCRTTIDERDFEVDEEMLHAMEGKTVPCGNLNCTVQVSVAHWREHQEECPEAIIACCHAEFGCTFSSRRTEHVQHRNSCPYEGIKHFLTRTRDEFENVNNVVQQLEAIVEEQGELIDALWPMSPGNPLNHLRFVYLIFWRWNTFPNEQARWLHSNFAHLSGPVFTILPFLCFVASTMLSPTPLLPVSFTDARVFSRALAVSSDWGTDMLIPKWVILMSLEAMCVGFLLELLLSTFYSRGELPMLSAIVEVIIRVLVVAGTALTCSVMSPIAITSLCLSLSIPGALSLLGGSDVEMQYSRQGVPIGILFGFVLTQSSGALLGLLVISFKVVAIVAFSLFPFSEHIIGDEEELLVIGDQGHGGPFDVELRLQLNHIMSALVSSHHYNRKAIVIVAAAVIPIILYIGFPFLPLSYGLFVIFHSILYMLPNYVVSSLRESSLMDVQSGTARCVFIFAVLGLLFLALPGVLRLPTAMNRLADYIDSLSLLCNSGWRVSSGGINGSLNIDSLTMSPEL